MPRLYHSASSIKAGAQCQRAWAYQYIDGIREKDVAWTTIAAHEEAGGKLRDAPYTSRQRSFALGKAMHTVGEDWFTHVTGPDWNSLPGQIFDSGTHLLPHPDKCVAVRVEEPIGAEPMPSGASEHAPPVGLRLHGILWAGYKDLVAVPATESELDRLGLPQVLEPILIDYKSSSNIKRYALTPEALTTDVQANLYAIDVCHKFGLTSVPARWVYFETKKVRRAKAVDTWIHLDQALDLLEAPAALAKELDRLTSSDAAPQNTDACGEYGGCIHHKNKGGPCNPHRSLAQLVRQPHKEDKKMALEPSTQKKFDALKDGGAEAAAPAKRKPRPAKAKAAAPTRNGSAAGKMFELNSDLVEAQEQLNIAQHGVDVVLTKMKETLA
jgi:hypothetical protein